MAIEGDIRSALLGVTSLVFPDFAPESVAKGNAAYITYQQIGGQGRRSIGKPDSIYRVRVQINVWAKTRLAANAMVRQAEDALHGAASTSTVPFTAVALDDATAVYDEDFGWYGAHQDFRIQWQR